MGTAAPTTGTWVAGDTVLNTAPTNAGVKKWICVTGGTPGTWEPERVPGLVLSPPQITANTNNYNPANLATAYVLRLSTDASRALTGIAGGSDRREIVLENIGSFDLVLQHDVTSTAANRFYCSGSVNFTLAPNGSVRIQYDSTSLRWRVISSLPSSERASASTTPAPIGTGYVGTEITDARADHVHPTGAGTPAAVGTANATGAGPAAAMTDHVHAHETAHVAHDTIWDARGDIVVATDADAAVRLAVGPNTQVLTADSTQATGMKWAPAPGSGAAAVATDAIWDAKGDLAAGTGADTAATLSLGANDSILMADSTATTGLKWVPPATPSTQAFGDAATVGTGDTFTRGDHKHAMPADPVTAHAAAADPHTGYVLESLLDAKGDIVVASANDTPSRLAVGADMQVLTADSTQATGVKWAAAAATGDVSTDAIWDAKGDLAAGTGANTASKLTAGADDTILMADAAASTGLKWAAPATPSTQAFGDAAAAGTADTFTRGDHKHAMPSERAAASATPAAVGTAAVGTGTTDARADHVHPTGAGTPSTQASGDAAATGTGPAAAMTDHKHAFPVLYIPVTFAVKGAVTTGAGALRWYNRSGRTLTFDSVSASVGTAPTGAALIVDVNVGGTTIYTTQASRPTIAISTNVHDDTTAPDVTTIADNGYLTVDVDQIGSTVAGSDLAVTIWLKG